MAIKKVTVDSRNCIATGLCERICPNVFEVDDKAKIKEGADIQKYETEIKEAAESCPVEVIEFEEE